MQKINYEIDGQVVEIEVSDEFVKSYQELELEEKRANERLKWHRRKNLMELEPLQELGFELEDKTVNIEKDFEKKEELESLRNAMQKLEPQQKWLVEQVYFLGRKQVDIARELRLSTKALNNRLIRIMSKIKKYLK